MIAILLIIYLLGVLAAVLICCFENEKSFGKFQLEGWMDWVLIILSWSLVALWIFTKLTEKR